MTTLFALGDVARLIKVPPHKIAYAISNGRIPDPEMRIAGKRIFTQQEAEEIGAYFSSKTSSKKENKTK
jgi:mono/diheme cytochrome c family protein